MIYRIYNGKDEWDVEFDNIISLRKELRKLSKELPKVFWEVHRLLNNGKAKHVGTLHHNRWTSEWHDNWYDHSIDWYYVKVNGELSEGW